MTNNEKSNAFGEWEVCGTGNGHSIHARCKSQACLRRENVIFRSNHDANTFSSCSLKASFLRPVFVDLHLLLLATGFSSTQSAFSLMSGICETWLFLPCGWSCWRRWSCTWHWPRMRLRQTPWPAEIKLKRDARGWLAYARGCEACCCWDSASTCCAW